MPIENERGDIMNMICIDIGRNKTEVARIKEIQGRISSGSIPVNGNSAVRRTLNF